MLTLFQIFIDAVSTSDPQSFVEKAATFYKCIYHPPHTCRAAAPTNLADFRSPLGGHGLPAKLAPSPRFSGARDVCVSKIALLSLTPTPYPQPASLSFLAVS